MRPPAGHDTPRVPPAIHEHRTFVVLFRLPPVLQEAFRVAVDEHGLLTLAGQTGALDRALPPCGAVAAIIQADDKRLPRELLALISARPSTVVAVIDDSGDSVDVLRGDDPPLHLMKPGLAEILDALAALANPTTTGRTENGTGELDPPPTEI